MPDNSFAISDPNDFTISSCHNLNQDILLQLEKLNSCMPGYELYYEESSPSGEDVFFAAWKASRLIGFFSFIYVPECDEAEITALVAPDMRGQGVFRSLLKEARVAAGRLGIEHFYYAPPAGSMPQDYSHSEYLLRLDCSDICCRDDAYADRLHFPEEMLEAGGLSYHADDEGAYIFCCITDSEDDILSSCYLSNENSYICIWGVETAPQHRRQGFASLLMQCILSSADSIFHTCSNTGSSSDTAPVFVLQVSSRNTAAMKLYKKYGFVTESRIDYYSVHS